MSSARRTYADLLHWRWDPIGISGEFPWAGGEYDSRALPVFTTLNRGAAAGGIDDRLSALATGILAWFDASQARWVEFGPLHR